VPIFLSEKEIVQLIKDKPKGQDLILTGSHRPLPAVFEFADTVTECRKTKHHFDRGILARKGIEY
jgi:cob(I)alamin adenosyltransferase